MFTHTRRVVVPALLIGALLAGAAASAAPRTAQAAGSRVATQPAATLVLATTAVKAGGTVKLTAYNFAPNEMVAITFSGLGSPLVSLRASSGGTLSAKVTIPAKLSNGLHLLIATGATSLHSAYALVIVAGAAPTASPAPQASTATALLSVTISGRTISLLGRNFAPSEKVALLLDHAATPLATVHASTAGTVSTKLTVAATSGGIIHMLTAVGVTSGRTAIATFTLKA